MNAIRLRKLYDFMAALPSQVIDMDSWRQSEGMGYNTEITNKDLREAIVNPSCGTQACALGWACSMPDFKQEGLRYKKDCEPGETTKYYVPTYGEHTGFDAGASFFDLKYEDASSLFDAADIDSDDIDEQHLTHKQLFLNRIRNLMVKEKIISKQEALNLHIKELELDYEQGVY